MAFEELADAFLVRGQHLALRRPDVNAAPPREEVIRGRVEVPAAVAQPLVEVVPLVGDEQIGLDEQR